MHAHDRIHCVDGYWGGGENVAPPAVVVQMHWNIQFGNVYRFLIVTVLTFLGCGVQAYIQETLAFCECLVNDKPSPCSGEDGLMALIMAIAAGKSAEEGRWVR